MISRKPDRITLKEVKRKYDLEDMIRMFTEEAGICDVFGNKVSRIFNSNVMTLIWKNDKVVGFLNLVDEHMDGFLFMDIGIIESERGKGYSILAVKDLLDRLTKKDFHIIGEVKKDNIPSNKNGERMGKKVLELDERNFYLIGEDSLTEDEIANLREHFDYSRLIKNLDN